MCCNLENAAAWQARESVSTWCVARAGDEKIETPRNFQATLSLDISEMPERLAE